MEKRDRKVDEEVEELKQLISTMNDDIVKLRETSHHAEQDLQSIISEQKIELQKIAEVRPVLTPFLGHGDGDGVWIW